MSEREFGDPEIREELTRLVEAARLEVAEGMQRAVRDIERERLGMNRADQEKVLPILAKLTASQVQADVSFDKMLAFIDRP